MRFRVFVSVLLLASSVGAPLVLAAYPVVGGSSQQNGSCGHSLPMRLWARVPNSDTFFDGWKCFDYGDLLTGDPVSIFSSGEFSYPDEGYEVVYSVGDGTARYSGSIALTGSGSGGTYHRGESAVFGGMCAYVSGWTCSRTNAWEPDCDPNAYGLRVS